MTRVRRGLVRSALAVFVLAVVLASVDIGRLLTRAATADPRVVVGAVIGLVLVHAVAAVGWRSIARVVSGTRLGLSQALRIYYSAQALGGVTPASLGGDLYRVAALRSRGEAWSASVAPIVMQRATSYAALGVLSLAGCVALASTPVALPVVLVGCAFAVAIAAASWLLLAPPRWLRRVARPTPRPGDPTFAAPGRALPPAAFGGALAIGFLSGLAFHAASLLLTWTLVMAVDPSTGTLPVLATLTVARLALAVPITPSGLGVTEATAAAIIAAIGGPVESVLGGLLIVRLAMVVTTVLGLAIATRPGADPPAAGWRSRPGGHQASGEPAPS